ncbi:periplasmic multidrug efflux lipoprotein precursor [Chryseobacterium indoltheticum]|uniref:Periplasmic multidrug efflux lipoprotein n=2 Tax=Chryseobacterium indoltheticum TaxID=254 RepID=A0A381FQ80_9FLAO|nr:periplasmic multidrug efflux lipoprotein precursor [Chryseobacterium indoltheticum]
MNTMKIIWCNVALICVLSCNKNKTNKVSQNKEVPVLQVAKKDTLISTQFVADIQAKSNVEMRARIGGIIQKIYVNEGQFVKRGQPLFKINDAEL